jgi:hypothetical protein
MIDIRSPLKEGDPVRNEPELSSDDIQRMRRVVLAESTNPTGWWPRPVLVATTIAVTLAAGIALGRRLPDPAAGTVSDGGAPAPLIETESPARGRVRQLQFSTRGGTRVIWIFNSDFTL